MENDNIVSVWSHDIIVPDLKVNGSPDLISNPLQRIIITYIFMYKIYYRYKLFRILFFAVNKIEQSHRSK